MSVAQRKDGFFGFFVFLIFFFFLIHTVDPAGEAFGSR